MTFKDDPGAVRVNPLNNYHSGRSAASKKWLHVAGYYSVNIHSIKFKLYRDEHIW